MKQKIRKIGNSMGLIIPQYILKELGLPEIVELEIIDGCLSIRPSSKAIRRKPRDKDEVEGLYNIMKANIESNIKKGKVRWVKEREMKRTIC
jgi:antitoxin component of MazEF toxin-antitoxin module